jgi:hypothetical protein
MSKLASFTCISLFDARSGYWHTKVKQECQELLGFAYSSWLVAVD